MQSTDVHQVGDDENITPLHMLAKYRKKPTGFIQDTDKKTGRMEQVVKVL